MDDRFKLKLLPPLPKLVKSSGKAHSKPQSSKSKNERIEVHYLLISPQGEIMLEPPRTPKIGETVEVYTPCFPTGTESIKPGESLLDLCKQRINRALNITDTGALLEIARVRMGSTQISVVTCCGSVSRLKAAQYVWWKPSLPSRLGPKEIIKFNRDGKYFIVDNKHSRILMIYGEYQKNGRQRIVGKL